MFLLPGGARSKWSIFASKSTLGIDIAATPISWRQHRGSERSPLHQATGLPSGPPFPHSLFVTAGQRATLVFSWPRTSCLLVRLQCFLSFQTTKASLSCTPELLGICLLLNPRAHVLGRRRGRSRNTWPVSEQRVPGAPVPWLGSRSEHSLL